MKVFLLALAMTVSACAQDDGKLTIDIPAPVQATIGKETVRDGKVIDFKRVNETDGTTFIIGIAADGKRYELSLDAAGRLMRKRLDVENTGPKEIEIEKLPANVRENFRREAGAATVQTIEMHEAKTTYVSEVVIGNRRYRIEIDADGVLLQKEYVGDDER